MRICVVGATGWIGGSVMREALSQGHEVTAVSHSAEHLAALGGVPTAVADVLDTDRLAGVIRGHDAVVCAVTDRSTDDRSIIPRAARSVLAACGQAGVERLVFCGGGGSLEVRPGVQAIDEPGFPPQHRAEALAQAEALDVFRSADTSVEWTYASPPPHHLEPGEKRGGYHARVGDTQVVDDQGESRLTAGDFAVAILYALTEHVSVNGRFTAAYMDVEE
jgi:putative NADH-flavin reductase